MLLADVEMSETVHGKRNGNETCDVSSLSHAVLTGSLEVTYLCQRLSSVLKDSPEVGVQ